jgi:hypothetical protein
VSVCQLLSFYFASFACFFFHRKQSGPETRESKFDMQQQERKVRVREICTIISDSSSTVVLVLCTVHSVGGST